MSFIRDDDDPQTVGVVVALGLLLILCAASGYLPTTP